MVALSNSSGTKCPKCDKTNFELVEDVPTGTQWIHLYLRCSSCKTFLQMVPHDNTNVLIDNLQKDITKIKKFLKIID